MTAFRWEAGPGWAWSSNMNIGSRQAGKEAGGWRWRIQDPASSKVQAWPQGKGPLRALSRERADGNLGGPFN